MKKLLLLGSVSLAILMSFVAIPLSGSLAFADAKGDICNGVGGTGGGTCAGSGGDSIGTVFQDVVNILSIVVGVVSVIMIIIAGFQYVISQGDSGKISNAKNTIIYALVGVVVVAFSQFLVKFVLHGIGI